MSTYVKICGITSLDDALAAVEAGADALGFNFYPESPRFIEWADAAKILEDLPPAIHRVGVFVNADMETVIDVATDLALDCVQFHGDETPEFCAELARPWYKAFRLKTEEDLAAISDFTLLQTAPWILVDASSSKGFGGTGEHADWDLARRAKKFGKLMLAGGLTPENILSALEAVHPDAVDVASGVERKPGVKDPRKMQKFVESVKTWSLASQHWRHALASHQKGES